MPEDPEYHKIKIRDHLDRRWSQWFAGLQFTRLEGDETLLSGLLPNQAALHGLLERIRDLNLTLISVTRGAPSRIQINNRKEDNMNTLLAGSHGMTGPAETRHLMVRKVLLVCGILAALLYVGSDIVAAMRWEGYSYIDQSVSELRAIGAPTRPFLMPILTLYSVLEFPFAVGVWLSAGQKRSVRLTAVLLFALGLLDLSAYFFPMQVRENLSQRGSTLTDTMHLILTGVTVLLMLLIIGFGANADGRWWRFYSYATILLLIVGGAWAAMATSQVQANLPTPWLGVKERLNIYGYMLWLAVLALTLLRAKVPAATGELPARISPPQLTRP